jgi:hypothetical protein
VGRVVGSFVGGKIGKSVGADINVVGALVEITNFWLGDKEGLEEGPKEIGGAVATVCKIVGVAVTGREVGITVGASVVWMGAFVEMTDFKLGDKEGLEEGPSESGGTVETVCATVGDAVIGAGIGKVVGEGVIIKGAVVKMTDFKLGDKEGLEEGPREMGGDVAAVWAIVGAAVIGAGTGRVVVG